MANISFGTSTSLFVILTQLLLAGAINVLWSMIHALQIISFIPLMDLKIPANLLQFMSKFNYFTFSLPDYDSELKFENLFLYRLELWSKNSLGTMILKAFD